MIVPMHRVRILGPRDRLPAALAALQNAGSVHLAAGEARPPLVPIRPSDRDLRLGTRIDGALEDVEVALASLGNPPRPARATRGAPESGLPEIVRAARRLRRAAERQAAHERALAEERKRIERLREFFACFERLPHARPGEALRTYHLILPATGGEPGSELVAALDEILDEPYVLERSMLPSGEWAVVVAAPRRATERLEALIEERGIRDLEIPDELRGRSFRAARRALEERLRGLDREATEIRRARAELAGASAPRIHEIRGLLLDRRRALEAMELATATPRLFVLEGWVPEARLAPLRSTLARRVGGDVVLEDISREQWRLDEAPVALSNPPVFRPFEALTRLVPLPVYGSIDPTPFVAIFFPMFFGLILGDVGYGMVLAVVATLARRRGRPGSVLRAAANIALACAAFSVAFGMVYGELFGDLGRRWLGLHPLGFSREEALVPFLGFAVAIGLVHVLLGLVLGAVASFRREPRRSLGRGLAAAMLIVVLAALLATVEILPGRFFRPAVVTLLVLFPVMIAVEGIVAPIELFSTFTHVLSYARIMALGTASVIMAILANELAGAVGSVAVGILIGLLFHLVNFFLGVFSPAIQALRLQYVEFFGKFYSPGGVVYRPFRHEFSEESATTGG